MAKLNSNNFLVWDGNFTPAQFTLVAVNDIVNTSINQFSVDFSPLDNDISDIGFDFASLVITQQSNNLTPATWNPNTKKITFYLPANPVPSSFQLKYTIDDLNGNHSNEAIITVNIVARATAWRGYGPSYSCETDGSGNRTGKGIFAQLIQYYTDDNSEVSPQNLKNNSVSDPNYVAPVDDSQCNSNFYIQYSLNYNGAQNPIVIYADGNSFYLTTGVYLYKNSGLTIPADDGNYLDNQTGRTYVVAAGQIVNVI